MSAFRRTRLFPAVLAAAVFASYPAAAASARAAGPTQAAAESWTVTPGGAITGTSGQAVLQDEDTGSSIICTRSTTAGSLKSGNGLPGAGIGSLTSVSFSDCAGPTGLTFVIQTSASKQNPWRLNAKSYAPASGQTNGTITNIMATLTSQQCSATLAGPAASTPGTAEVTYTNRSNQLQLLSRSGGTIHIWNVSGCSGLFDNGDTMYCKIVYKIQPRQTIIGLPGDIGPDMTGPPC
jgi:hypothetical protein